MAANYPVANHSLMAVALGNYVYGAAATLFLTRPIATIQAQIPGTMPQSPICLRAARLPPRELITADGYSQEATSTSPSAPARSHGIPLPTPGITCQIWCRLAITSEAQPQANPSTPSPAILLPARRPMTTSSTPKPALQRHQRQQRRLRQLRLQRQRPPLQRLLPQQQQYTYADTYGVGNADRDGDSNSYTYFDTETFTDAESCANA